MRPDGAGGGGLMRWSPQIPMGLKQKVVVPDTLGTCQTIECG